MAQTITEIYRLLKPFLQRQINETLDSGRRYTYVGVSIIDNRLGKISQTVGYAAFTDGGAAVGTFDLTDTIPVGATVLASAVPEVTGFAGDTSAVMTIGDGSDVDRYNTGTIDVFATAANGVAAGAVSGVAYHDAAATVKLTITTATDWGLVSAGSVTVEIFYLT